MPVPLSILDLVPLASGSDAGEALRNSVDLAQRAEGLGYHRYWFAEHHLNAGVAGSAPPVLIAAAAAATTRLRVGSGGVQMGHRTPLSVVEEFGLLDALHPGRIDLGMGRSGGRDFLKDRAERHDARRRPSSWRTEDEFVGGLRLPPVFRPGRLVGSPRFVAQGELLQQPGAQTPPYADQVEQVLALLAGSVQAADRTPLEPVPGAGAGVEVWILGSSAGDSAAVAGRHGLRFAANYHVSPATVLEAVDAYREAFVPGAVPEPWVGISADVVVAPTEDEARHLALGYPAWVRGIRRGDGAAPYATPEEAAALAWSPEDLELVGDRVRTQFVGTPDQVVEGLRILQEVTGADELVITSMTHDHKDRVRSYELLAGAWEASG